MPKVPKAPKKAKATDEVMSIPMIRAKLSDVSLSFEPTTVEFENEDGETISFEEDPCLKAKVNIMEVIVGSKEHEGKSFWQRWRMKWNPKKNHWEVRAGTSYGNLVEVRYGEGILDEDDPRDLILEEEDFENFELLGTVEPKKDRQTKKEIGSMLKWDGIWPVDDGAEDSPEAKAAQAANDAELDELPDDHEEQIHDKLGV